MTINSSQNWIENLDTDLASKAFIKKHNLKEHELFDAAGEQNSVYKSIMKEDCRLFAYNAVPCKNGAHTLRDRANHCIVCSVQSIQHMRRTKDGGLLYVSGSKHLGLKKVGFTQDLHDRHRRLIQEGYAGATDWELLGWTSIIGNAGEIECELHSDLSSYKCIGLFYDNKNVKGAVREVYKCNINIVFKAIWDAIPDGSMLEVVGYGQTTKQPPKG
jgi:hypothetical protein